MAEDSEATPTALSELDLYRARRGPSLATIARFLGRATGVLVGLGFAGIGMLFYLLRCFDTCPTDPAEDSISQIFTLSLVGLGTVTIAAAATLGTRWALAGTWIMTVLGGLMLTGGTMSLVLVPSLQFPGDRSATVMLAILDTAVGAGLMLVGRWVRSQRARAAERYGSHRD